MIRTIVTFLLLVLSASLAQAQSITGAVTDAVGGAAIPDVVIQNIHTDAAVPTDRQGGFSIGAKPGQLIEFRKLGYITRRIRITSAGIPFYRIGLTPGVQELEGVEVRNNHPDFKHDSLRYREYFKKQLDYQTVTGWRAIQSPFSAMSKMNRQMISFQKEYAWLERQKYVDYAFNEKLIANLTGLKGDSALRYMRQFRPSYELLRSMPEYDYFSYVKQTVMLWRQRQRMNGGGSRGGG